MATRADQFAEGGRRDGHAPNAHRVIRAGAKPGHGAALAARSTAPSVAAASPTEQLKHSLRRLLATLLERGYGIALDKVEQLARTFDEVAVRGGYPIGALFGGARAALSGRNPVWGAITGAVGALSPGAKAALIAVLVLALLLLPVTVVLVLLFLIVVAIVAVVRTRAAH